MQDESTPIQVGPDLEAELSTLIGDGHSVTAIKRLREATGVTLCVAKQMVEQRISLGQFKAQTPKGNPCPYCGQSLRTNQAQQCLECGMDWHDPKNVVRHGSRSR